MPFRPRAAPVREADALGAAPSPLAQARQAIDRIDAALLLSLAGQGAWPSGARGQAKGVMPAYPGAGP